MLGTNKGRPPKDRRPDDLAILPVAQDRLLVRQHAAPPGGFHTPFALQALSAVEQIRAMQADALFAFLQLFSHRAFI